MHKFSEPCVLPLMKTHDCTYFTRLWDLSKMTNAKTHGLWYQNSTWHVTSAPEIVVIIIIWIWLYNYLYLNLWWNEQRTGAFKIRDKNSLERFRCLPGHASNKSRKLSGISPEMQRKTEAPTSWSDVEFGEIQRACCARLSEVMANGAGSVLIELWTNCVFCWFSQLIDYPHWQSHSISAYHLFPPRLHRWSLGLVRLWEGHHQVYLFWRRAHTIENYVGRKLIWLWN